MRRPSDLQLLAGAVFLSAAGDLLALITLALLVHELTGSAYAVSALFATTMAPVVVLAPLAGRLADRVESTRVLTLASLAQAALAVGLALAGSELAAILALSALLAAGSAISQPAEFALVPVIAGDEGLTRANGVMEAARYAGFGAGPLLAAVLATAADPTVALLVNAASFLAIAVAARALRVRREPHPCASGAGRAREGAAHLWRDPVLRPTVLAATAALLFMSALMTAEVFYAKDVLGAGDAGYAALTVAWMAGMVAGATRLASRVPRSAPAVAALVALGVQGGAVALLTAWPVLAVALTGFFVGGLGHGVKNTLLRTLIARRVPGRAHGRAFAAYNAARNTAELAALGAGGVLVAGVGARNALLVAGMGPVLASLAGLLALHPVRMREPLPEAA